MGSTVQPGEQRRCQGAPPAGAGVFSPQLVHGVPIVRQMTGASRPNHRSRRGGMRPTWSVTRRNA